MKISNIKRFLRFNYIKLYCLQKYCPIAIVFQGSRKKAYDKYSESADCCSVFLWATDSSFDILI